MISLEVVGWDHDPKLNMSENIFDVLDKTRDNNELFSKDERKEKE